MKRKAFALFLALTMIFSMFSMAVMAEEPAVTADTEVVGTLGGEDMTLAQFKTASEGDIVLTKDIVVNEWTSIAAFKGTLDGAGHSISGLNAPLFDAFNGGTLKNLTVTGDVNREITTGTGSQKAGLYANSAGSNVTVENCVANGSVQLSYTIGYAYAGGFFGISSTGLSMTDCVNNAKVQYNTVQTYYGGGMVGNMAGSGSFTRCINTGDILVPNNTGTTLIGGIVGCQPNKDTTCTFVKCANYGAITSSKGANGSKGAGILGVVSGAGISNFTNCVNFGAITTVCMSSGIVADAVSEVKIDNCANFGACTTTQASNNCWAGGIMAYPRGAAKELRITNCINYGAISALNNAAGIAGGIVAVLGDGFDACSNNVNKGAISAVKYAGGIIGKMGTSNAFTMDNCYAYGTATAEITGGLFAWSNNAAAVTLNNCYGINTYTVAVGLYNSSAKNKTTFVFNNDAVADEALGTAFLKTEDELNALMVIRSLNVQTGKIEDGKFNIRLVAGLSDLQYSATGFELIRVEANGVPSSKVSKYSTTVYQAIKGYDANGNELEYKASELNSDYLSAIAINGIPADKTVTFIVRPYMMDVDDDSAVTYIYGSAYAITFVNGVLQTA